MEKFKVDIQKQTSLGIDETEFTGFEISEEYRKEAESYIQDLHNRSKESNS